MRNFTLSMIAVLICSMAFGQKAPLKQGIELTNPISNTSKSPQWLGTMEAEYVVPFPANMYLGMALTSTHIANGNKITKIKFMVEDGNALQGSPAAYAGYNNKNFTLCIFKNLEPDEYGDILITGLTPVYTQPISVADFDEEEEFELTPPYTFTNETNVIIALKCLGKTTVLFADEDDNYTGPSTYYSVVDNGDTYLIESYLNDAQPGETPDYHFYPMTMQVYVDDSGSGVSDITAPTFKVYPNPSTGVVNISVNEVSTVTVYDVTGKLINTAHVNAGEVYTFTQTTAGMYFVNVNGSVRKVVVK